MSHSADLRFEEKAVRCAMEFTAEPFQSENMGCVLRPKNNSEGCVCKPRYTEQCLQLHPSSQRRTLWSRASYTRKRQHCKDPVMRSGYLPVCLQVSRRPEPLSHRRRCGVLRRSRCAPPIDNARKTRKARRQQSATRMRYPRGAAPEVPARCGHLSALSPANVPTLYSSAQSSGHPRQALLISVSYFASGCHAVGADFFARICESCPLCSPSASAVFCQPRFGHARPIPSG